MPKTLLVETHFIEAEVACDVTRKDVQILRPWALIIDSYDAAVLPEDTPSAFASSEVRLALSGPAPLAGFNTLEQPDYREERA